LLARAGAKSGFLQRLVSRGRTPATIAARLTYDDVTHRYGDLEAVAAVSLDVAPGEIVCLIGQSGCGKTTMLRLAAGVEMPTAGRILINGQDVTHGATLTPPERRGVGLMFQDFALFPHLTNLANVMFGLKALPKAEAEREARLALDRVGLADLADAYPHTLSGGEQQRVALARAVAPRPSVLLMDEPFSGLDHRLRDEVREDTLAVLRETRATCIIVTHDPEEALRLGDRIALMRAGRMVQVDEPEAIYRRPKDIFVARYFCDLNEVAGRVQSGKVETPVGLFPAPGLADGTEAIVAIRPQGVQLRPAGLCIPGMLEHRRFLGVVELLDIAVNGLDAPLKARVRQSVGFAVKSEVGVEIDPAEVLVFAAAGA
jgi:iron(III) transport system ATP-binding protein